jgi:hypothetical protein
MQYMEYAIEYGPPAVKQGGPCSNMTDKLNPAGSVD